MFPGFPPEALTFFRRLARNNRREWFQPRKEIFESQVKEPMVRLVEDINAQLLKFAPEHVTDPRKAIYRIYRDTRFSADKTPYKTHIAAIFPRRGLDRTGGAGLYIGISLEGVEIAGGSYMPGPETLRVIRIWLAEHYEEFQQAARGPRKLMGELQGSSLKRIPKGFNPEHPAADLIKKKQWYYGVELDAKMATSPKLLPEILKRFRAMTPIIEMLNAALTAKRATATSRLPDYW